MSEIGLKELHSVLMSLLNMQRTLLFNQSAHHIHDLLQSERGSDPLRIMKSGRKVFSQNDEDGIIAEIFRRIGTESRKFLEFGVETGIECNSLLLLNQGWTGAWFEANEKSVTKIRDTHKQFVPNSLKVVQTIVTAENINTLITDHDLQDIDLLSIDIDGNDFWVWKAISATQPRLLIIEYNAIMPPEQEWVISYDSSFVPDGSTYHSASLKSLELLGKSKGYSLVGCNLNGCNAFFVRNDLLLDRDGMALFRPPYTADNHYEPFRHPYLKFTVGKKVSTRRGTTDA